MSSSKDPFNFDDIYKEAGVDNLFVKKSMAQQKAMAKPVPATPPRPQQNSFGLATSPGGLGQLQRPVVSTTPVRTPMGGSGSKPSSASNLAGLDDPFAGLGGISKPPPMAAQKTPVRAATPPRASEPQPSSTPLAQQYSAPAAAPASSSPAASPAAPSVHAFDLEDMFGLGGASSSSSTKQPVQTSSAAAVTGHDDPFAAFGGVEGAAAAVPAAPQQPAAAVLPPAAADAPVSRQQARATAAAAGPSLEPHAPSAAGRSSGSRSDVPASYMSADSQAQQQQQQQQSRSEQRHHQQQPRLSDPAHDAEQRHSSRTDPASFSSLAAERAYGVDAVDGGYDRGQMWGGSGPGADSFSGSMSGGGKGWGGLLKSVTKTAATLGKKGLKAAQAGLAQLETAIDNLDKPGANRPHSSDGKHGTNGIHVQQQQQHERQFEDVPAERVLSMAIHISELPSSRQEDALARLPRPVRLKVMALLREQAVIEGEEQLSSSGSGAVSGQPGSAAAAAAAAMADGGFIPTREYNMDEAQAVSTEAAAAAAATRPAAAQQSARSAAAVPKPAAAAAAAAPAVEEEDLLGLHGPPAPSAAATAAAAGPGPAVTRPVDRLVSVSGIDDFFTGGPAAPTAAAAGAAPAPSSSKSSSSTQRPHTAGASSGASTAAATAASGGLGGRMSGSEGHLADLLGGSSSNSSTAAAQRPPAGRSDVGDLMGGLEVLHVDVDVSGHDELYTDGAGGGGGDEPELRRQLRAARAAEKHAKMKAALAEKQAKEAEEASRREQQQQHKQAHRERIEAWKNKNKGNVRGLLGSLQTVLWEDSGWQPYNMGDLLEPTQVRKAWMKANLLVHPDKVRQRNGSDEQVAIADMIFDALKEAWSQFRG